MSLVERALAPMWTTTCDTITPVSPFDATAYMGLWYEQYHVKDQFYQLDSWTCTTAQYSSLTSDGHFTVDNTSQFAKERLNERFGVTGQAYCPDPDNGASCYVEFFGAVTDYPNYNVIDTDYTSYTIVYECGDTGRAYLWLMTRVPDPPQSLLDYMIESAREKLPNFNESDVYTPKDEQGDMCTYP